MWEAVQARIGAAPADPFEHSWAICQHLRDVPPEEMQTAATAAFGG